MGRIIGIDYGTKRTGIAVTDPLQIIASPLETISTNQLFDYLKNYFAQEAVVALVIGQAMRADGTLGKLETHIIGFIRKMEKEFPDLEIYRQDESYSSQDARASLLLSGARKKKRREKGVIDKVSASLILQSFMEQQE